MAEDDESEAEGPSASVDLHDNSLGRLLTLSDGIFAIAMTLLTLDLKVPTLTGQQTDAALRHALAHNSASYWSFLLSFYVVASYWLRHRQLMRFVVAVHPALIRDTLFLLVIIAAMPFPASLLGQHGGLPIALAIYGAVNVAAILTLMLLNYDLHHLALVDTAAPANDYTRQWSSWVSLVVFLLCIPAGFVLHGHGPYVLLLLLVVPARAVVAQRIVPRVRGGR